MTRRKPRKRARRKILPNDVLEGRVEVRPEELYELIHQVNPTGRGLSRREAQRRYAQKNRLQSFLLLHFGADVVVRPTEDAGVVSLDHPSGLADACHARVDELTPEARAWVWRHLDLAASGGSANEDAGTGAAAAVPPAADPADKLTAAQRAMAGYDYTAADTLLHDVLDEAPDDSDEAAVAAHELAVLLVDVLGLDAEALAFGKRLRGRPLGDPDVRGLLALAAARQGDLGAVREYLAGVPNGRRRAEVCAVLARAAGRDGDADACRGWLAELRASDPAHEAVAEVERTLGELAASGLPEAEERLGALYRAGGWEAAAEAARELADRWPGSTLARLVLREAAAERRRRKVARDTEAGDRAFRGEDYAQAARCYQAVLDEEPEAPGIAQRLADAVEKARQKEEEDAVARVRRLLDEGIEAGDGGDAILCRGLHAYFELAPERRVTLIRHYKENPGGHVEEHFKLGTVHLLLVELETLYNEHPYPKKIPALITAVLALQEIFRRLDRKTSEGGDPDGAVELYRRHATLLDELTRGRLVAGVCATLEKRKRRDAELRKFQQAQELMVEASTTGAGERLLATLDLDAFEGDERDHMQGLLDMSYGVRDLQRLAMAYGAHLARNELLAARRTARAHDRLLDELAETLRRRGKELPPDFFEKRISEMHDGLDEEICEKWALLVEDGPFPRRKYQYPGFLQPRPGDLRSWVTEDRWLHPDGRRLALANTFNEWFFLRVVDVDSGKLLQRFSLHTPKPLGAPLTTCWDEDRNGTVLKVGGANGNVLVLAADADGWHIVEWCCLPEKAALEDVRQTLVLPGTPYAWVLCGDGEQLARVIDLRSGLVERERRGVRRLVGLGGEDGPRLLQNGRNGVFLGTPDGQLTPDVPLDERDLAAAAGDGDVLFLLLKNSELDEDDEDDEDNDSPAVPLRLARFEKDGDGWRPACEVLLGKSWRGSECRMAISDGAVFVLFLDVLGELRLSAFDRAALDELYTQTVPCRSTLAADGNGREVLLVYDSSRGSEIVRLGRRPPRLAWKWRPLEERFLPVSDVHVGCVSGGFATAFPDSTFKLAGRDRRASRRALLAMARDHRDKDALLMFAYGLVRRADALAAEYMRALIRRFGKEDDDLVLVMVDRTCLVAEKTGSQEEWEKAFEILRAIDVDRLTSYKRHYYHLWGLAALHNGAHGYEAFEKGLKHEDEECSCRLEELAEMAAKSPRWPPKPKLWDTTKSWTKQLMGMLQASSHYLKKDKDKEVRAILERPLTWISANRECLFRLAVVYSEEAMCDEVFYLRLNHAFYLEMLASDAPRQVFYPGVTTQAEQMEKIARVSRALLALDEGGKFP